jgi:chemotaxis protein methyltransferase CheR
MIYFDVATKGLVLGRLLPCLKRGGYLMIGHSDTLSGVTHELETVKTAIFRKASA